MSAAIRCACEWVDGSCEAILIAGVHGWESRIGRAGDQFWLCPTHAAEFPAAFGVTGDGQ